MSYNNGSASKSNDCAQISAQMEENGDVSNDNLCERMYIGKKNVSVSN